MLRIRDDSCISQMLRIEFANNGGIQPLTKNFNPPNTFSEVSNWRHHKFGILEPTEKIFTTKKPELKDQLRPEMSEKLNSEGLILA